MDKFDNTKPNIILLSDHSTKHYMMKSFGVYKIARELRLVGYQVAVIHHLHIFSYEEICKILKTLISSKTLFVGFNNTFFRPPEEGGSVHVFSDTCVGAMLPQGVSYNQKLKKYIYTLNPNCKLVLGGPSADDKNYNKDFDYIVIGYADRSVINLANHLAYRFPLENSSIGENGSIIINDPVAAGFDFSTRKMEYKEYDCLIPNETLFLEIARGCIFKCSFCSFPLNGKKKLDYIKDKDILIEELLENYKKYGITRYIFLDDTFNDSYEKVKLIYDISKEIPFSLEFWAYIRLDLLAANPETIDMMIEAGLKGCQFGIESMHIEACKSIGKGMNPEKQIETLRYIKEKYGDQVFLHASFIAGLPYEPIESMINTYKFFLNSKDKLLDSAEVHPMGLEDYRNSKRTFKSKISENPESYGYRFRSDLTKGMYFWDWENEHTNFAEVMELAEKYRRLFQSKMNKIIPQDMFFLSSFGYSWKDFEKYTQNNFDWNDVQKRKSRQADLYKKLVSKNFNIIFENSLT